MGLNQIRPRAKRGDSVKKNPVYKILIVCEGARTEPLYFKNFKIGSYDFVYDIEIKGEGKNTTSLVDVAIQLNKKNSFNEVWAVFDKDGFSANQFNGAILHAKANGIHVAWSNEAFELWFILHLKSISEASLSRTQYSSIISEEISAKSGKKFEYKKNDATIYNLITQYGDQEKAIKRAQTLESNFHDASYHKHNPCTLVHRLVERLDRLMKGELSDDMKDSLKSSMQARR